MKEIVYKSEIDVKYFPYNRSIVVRFFLPDDVFLPCDHGLDFLHEFIM